VLQLDINATFVSSVRRSGTAYGRNHKGPSLNLHFAESAGCHGLHCRTHGKLGLKVTFGFCFKIKAFVGISLSGGSCANDQKQWIETISMLPHMHT
jgi:hypothetical protein